MIEKINYNNWIFPNEETINADFKEYKLKEDKKWKYRAHVMGFQFPIFDTLTDFKNALGSAQVVVLTQAMDRNVMNRSHTSSIASLKFLVSRYSYPRDVDRIVNGYIANAPIPMPVILKGKHGMWIMTGNTRSDAAFIMGFEPRVMLIDVSV